MDVFYRTRHRSAEQKLSKGCEKSLTLETWTGLSVQKSSGKEAGSTEGSVESMDLIGNRESMFKKLSESLLDGFMTANNGTAFPELL